MIVKRLENLIGKQAARVHDAGECYIANVRCFLTYRQDEYERDAKKSYEVWIEEMRKCVAEFDAKQQPAREPDVTKRRYGWRPDLPDLRDYPYIRAALGGALPAKVDLRPDCSAVEDQGNLGSCTANAIVGAMEYAAIRARKPAQFSRLFIYYRERVREGSVDTDSGAEIRDGIKECAKVGAPFEALWPYVIAKFAKKPSAAATANALHHKITEYRLMSTLDDVLHCLAAGSPVVIGFTVYDSFESDATAHSGIMTMPVRGERVLGGHAVLVVGYDMAARMAICRNSWGTEWGDQGYFYMPFKYFSTQVNGQRLATDFWTITAEML